MNATRNCTVSGCERKIECRELCAMHYSRKRRTGSTADPVRHAQSAICSIEGCGRPRGWLEWCKAHGRRWRKYGDPLGSAGVNGVDWNVRADCKVDGCGRKAHAHRFCPMHLTRWQKHGDPLYVQPITGRPLKGKHITFAGVHKRLSRVNGPAKDYDCADCGKRAAEWSYKGGCPDELIGAVGGFECAYTENLDYYEPRCTSCHRKLDGAGARPRTARGTFACGKSESGTQ